ncbi:MAG: hypothetical protein ACRDC7_19500 [Aeromonas veronii]
MKKAILCAVVALGLLSGCSATADLRDHQEVEAQAMRDYHASERKVARADEAIKVAADIGSGVKVAAYAKKALAEAERQAAYSKLTKILSENRGEVFDNAAE